MRGLDDTRPYIFKDIKHNVAFLVKNFRTLVVWEKDTEKVICFKIRHLFDRLAHYLDAIENGHFVWELMSQDESFSDIYNNENTSREIFIKIFHDYSSITAENGAIPIVRIELIYHQNPHTYGKIYFSKEDFFKLITLVP